MDSYMVVLKDNHISLTPYKRKSAHVARSEIILKQVMRDLQIKMYRYLCALDMFEFVPVRENVGICTDGKYIYYNPDCIIGSKSECEKKRLEYKIAHIVAHGLLGHFEANKEFRNKELAWVIMDAQVDVFLNKIGVRNPQDQIDNIGQSDNMDEDEVTEGFSCYYQALQSKKKRRMWQNMWLKYYWDNHNYWKTSDCEKWKQVCAIVLGKSTDTMQNGERIKEIMLFAGMDNKTIDFGKNAGQTCQNVRMAAENNMSYREVLQKMVCESECERELPDTLDTMLYTYGLELYGDVPLVEPSEINEVKHLNVLVLAVDTSGSCSGNIAGRFLRETCNILRDLRSVGEFEAIYLIECDTVIQKEKCLNSVDELFMEEIVEMRGFGGTSFVPVFNRIEELKKKHGVKVDGLLYLTDTEGEFPNMKPDYPVCLIVPEENIGINGRPYNRNIPDWADYVVIE